VAFPGKKGKKRGTVRASLFASTDSSVSRRVFRGVESFLLKKGDKSQRGAGSLEVEKGGGNTLPSLVIKTENALKLGEK